MSYIGGSKIVARVDVHDTDYEQGRSFFAPHIVRLGEFDASNAENLNNYFAGCTALETIDKLIVSSDGKNTQTYTNAFTDCKSLANISVEGTIGQSVNFADCPLTTDSMISIIEHLKNFYYDDASYGTRTLTFSEECWTALAERDEECPMSHVGYGWRRYVEGDYMWNT